MGNGGKILIVELDPQARHNLRCRDIGNLEVGIHENAAEVWLKEHHASLHGGPEFAALLRPHADDPEALERVALDRLAEHLASETGEMARFLQHFRSQVALDTRTDVLYEIRAMLDVDC